jgi:hypothetical protein
VRPNTCLRFIIYIQLIIKVGVAEEAARKAAEEAARKAAEEDTLKGNEEAGSDQTKKATVANNNAKDKKLSVPKPSVVLKSEKKEETPAA